MKQIIALPSFERAVKKLNSIDKKLISESLEKFNNFVFTGFASFGLGVKKINHDKYEFRAGIRLRVVVKVESDMCYLVLAGNHDDVKRYLRKFR